MTAVLWIWVRFLQVRPPSPRPVPPRYTPRSSGGVRDTYAPGFRNNTTYVYTDRDGYGGGGDLPPGAGSWFVVIIGIVAVAFIGYVAWQMFFGRRGSSW